MKIKALFVAIAIASGAGAATVQDSQYAAFVERTNVAAPPPSIEAMTPPALETLQAMARQEGRCVPSALVMEMPQTAIATLVVTRAVAAGQIKNGWTAYARPDGCPGAGRARFLILRMADDSLRALFVNEGESLANPSLMRDSSAGAAMAAFGAVSAADPSCTGDGMRMGPTRVAERGADLGANYHGVFYAGSWREIWTFTVCGRTVEVPVAFTADGQGGAHFNVRSTEARIAQ